MKRAPTGSRNYESLERAGRTLAGVKEWLHCGRQPLAAQLSRQHRREQSSHGQSFWWRGLGREVTASCSAAVSWAVAIPANFPASPSKGAVTQWIR